MKQELIDIKKIEINKGQIQGLPRNPRFIKDRKYSELLQSIEESPEMLELRELIIYPKDKGYVTICGNSRLRAMKELNFKKAPCKVLPVETPVEKLKEYSVKDNISAGEFNWDFIHRDWEEDKERLRRWGMEIPYEEMTQDDMDSKYNNSNCEYPLIPMFDEKYTSFIIICESATEEAAVRTKFDFPRRAKSYKNKFLGETNVIKAKQIL
jgi:hypothetical protein